jgi:biopolymer transport protein ExbD
VAISVNGGGNGNGGGRRRFHGSSAMSDINVTPFVDVVLVLLIIFMMTAHVVESGVEVDVPKTKTTVEKPLLDNPVVVITNDGRFFLNDQPVGNIHNLPDEIRRRFRNPKAVYLKADKETPWDVAVQVMSELGDAKLPVSVVTQPEDESKKRMR